ncbi:MAG: hypothetical protein ACPG4X_16960 [Pikeienuella sp.]
MSDDMSAEAIDRLWKEYCDASKSTGVLPGGVEEFDIDEMNNRAWDLNEHAKALAAEREQLRQQVHDALWCISVRLAYCPENLTDAQKGVVHAGLIADDLCQAINPDPANPPKVSFEQLIESARQQVAEARNMGLDEAADWIDAMRISNRSAAIDGIRALKTEGAD